MINRILVPLDGSKVSEQALARARSLASATESEIVLLTAIARQERWANADTPTWEAEEEATATGYLDVLKRELHDAGIRVSARVVWGRPADVIRQVADEANASLIVMTTHGRSGVARLLIGSVADNVLRTAERPLMLVRAQQEPASAASIQTILVPLDGSPFAEAGLPFVKDLALELSTNVVLTKTVVPPALLYGEQYLPSGNQVMETLEAEARDYLDEKSKPFEEDGVGVKTVVTDGFPVEAIITVADTYNADLIAMTSHGRTGPSRTVLGSVADGLIRQSHRPCLIVPVRPHSEPEQEIAAPAVLGIEPAPIVVPAPSVLETPGEEEPRAKAPGARPHRPERIPGRRG